VLYMAHWLQFHWKSVTVSVAFWIIYGYACAVCMSR
jgi:hypothetical protein